MKTLEFVLEEMKHYGHKLCVDFSNIHIEVRKPYLNPFDDHYGYEILEGNGILWGHNERSVLLGFYHLLRNLGVKFLGPGEINERIPVINQKDIKGHLNFKPKYRHRVVCIEGSTNIKHVKDMIDHLPKVGMNGYFIQFDFPSEFFERWYKEQNIEIDITLDDVKRYKEMMIQDIKKRGLIYHAVGHGWTTKVLGITGTGWHKKKLDQIDPEKIEWLAKVNGKRSFFKDIPLNTQLCYSRFDVQHNMAKSVLDYLLSNPDIDILHFWLADDFNNFCTCDECIKHPPSYYYVQILNQIDELLSKHNINTKIAFLAYYELLWPTQLKIKNEDRFILMFAPITRTYASSIRDIDIDDKPLESYKISQEKFSSDLSTNLKFLKAWKKNFTGDSFIFDYHLMWDGFKETSHLKLGKVIKDDIETLDLLGLNGYISCQLTRQMFPHGVAMHVLTKSLSEGIIDFEQEVKSYFQDYDLKHGQVLYKFFSEIKEFIPHAYMRGELKNHQDVISLMEQGLAYLKSYEKYKDIDNIKIFIIYYEKVFTMIKYKALNDFLKYNQAYEDLVSSMENYYDILESKLDYFYLKLIFKEFIELKNHEEEGDLI